MIWSLFTSSAVAGHLAVQLTSGPTGALALSAALVAVVALVLALRPTAGERVEQHRAGIGVAVGRDTGRGPLVIPQLDPDAALRPRPRAPSGLACSQ